MRFGRFETLPMLVVALSGLSCIMLGLYVESLYGPSYGRRETGKVSVTKEEAIEKAFELIRRDMEWIEVEGANWTKATLVLRDEAVPIGDYYRFVPPYYVWSVEIEYDKYYKTPDGAYWIVGYWVEIRADTMEVTSHGHGGVYST